MNEVEKAYIANNSLPLLQWIQSKAVSFLNEIKGYLIVKKQQAELITGEYKAVTHRAGKYTPEMLMKKEVLVAKIRKLNLRRQIDVSYNTPGSLTVKVKGEEIVHAIQK